MREDPTGKRALFSSTPHARPRTTGKKALFSTEIRLGTPISVECSDCGHITDVSVTEALGRVLRLGVVVPGKEFPVRMRCPACGRRAWVRITPA